MIGKLGVLFGWSISAGETLGNGFREEVEIISNAPNHVPVADEAKKRPVDLSSSAN